MALLGVLCLISICYLFFLGENIRNNSPKKIVYYASNVSVVGPLIVKYLLADGKWHEKHPFIELGGGLAPLARYVGRCLTFTKLIAIEWTRSLCAAGRIKNVFAKPQIKYVRELIENYAVPEPSVLYCYLSEKILTEQYERGLFSGCLVFCLTFKIIGVEPTAELPVNSWQSPLRVYDFR